MYNFRGFHLRSQPEWACLHLRSSYCYLCNLSSLFFLCTTGCFWSFMFCCLKVSFYIDKGGIYQAHNAIIICQFVTWTILSFRSLAWCYMPVINTPGTQMQKDEKFKSPSTRSAWIIWDLSKTISRATQRNWSRENKRKNKQTKMFQIENVVCW